MQVYKLEILAPAWKEIEEMAEYHLMMVGPVSAKSITDQILLTIERLKTYPFLGKVVLDDELNMLGYIVVFSEKYACIYRVIEETVFVYHIVHSSRDYPGLFKM